MYVNLSHNNADLVLEALIRAGLNVSDRDNSGNPPIYYAVVNDCSLCVEYLLKMGAKFDLKNDDRETPLDLAWRLGRQRCIELMKTSFNSMSH